MLNKYLLYIHSKNSSKVVEIADTYKLVTFMPSIYNLKKHKGNNLIYFYWYLFTLGKYFIIYIQKDQELVHSSICLTKFYKFPFMSKNDLEIGPCFTSPDHRGKSIYPYVLNYIKRTYAKKYNRFFIMTGKQNISSQKGIEKAGYEFKCELRKTKILGIYKY